MERIEERETLVRMYESVSSIKNKLMNDIKIKK